MAKREHKALCYYCGRQARSKEHAPPKQMFKAFSCDSITVPSCEDHNSAKGGCDQAIVSALLKSLYHSIEEFPPEDEVLKAIRVAEPSFERAKRRAISSALLKNPPEVLKDLPELVYLVPSMDIKGWMRQLTAAMVYDGTQVVDLTIGWPEAFVWSPHFLEAEDPVSVGYEPALSALDTMREIQFQLDQSAWEDGWSAYPRPYPSIIYAFQVLFAPNREVIFKHGFYNNRFTWYVRFSASEETLAKLREKLETQNPPNNSLVCPEAVVC